MNAQDEWKSIYRIFRTRKVHDKEIVRKLLIPYRREAALERKLEAAQREIECIKAPKCKCGVNFATEPHTCPYAEDIYNDHESLCTCCASCAEQCAMDI